MKNAADANVTQRELWTRIPGYVLELQTVLDLPGVLRPAERLPFIVQGSGNSDVVELNRITVKVGAEKHGVSVIVPYLGALNTVRESAQSDRMWAEELNGDGRIRNVLTAVMDLSIALQKRARH